MLKNFCIIVIGDTYGVKNEVQDISEIQINTLDAKGIHIATFCSQIPLKKIKETFKKNKRNFFVFELDEKYSVFHIEKKQIHTGLFGFLEDQKPIDQVIEIIKPEIIETNFIKSELTKSNIESLNKKEKEDLLNRLIEYGLHNLTPEEKELLSMLVE